MTIPAERLHMIAMTDLNAKTYPAAQREVRAMATELLAARDALAAVTKERDNLFNRVGALLHRVTDWREAFAMPDEPDAAAIERTRAALAATEGE